MASMQQLLLSVTWIQLTAHVLSCPVGTQRLGDPPWCVRYNATSVTFCDAIKTCHSNGEEMISKPVFDAMKSSPAFSGSGSSSWWVGLIDTVYERGSNKDGWVWMKDGQVTTETDGYFQSTEPNDSSRQDCVNIGTSDKQLRDAGCTELHPFYCYADPTVQTSNPAKFKFEKSNITDYNQPDPGCSQKLTNVPSLFHCTVKCFTIGPDCVGFYWNPARQECITLPYFDAVVTLDHVSHVEKLKWEKYLRTG